MTNNQHGQVPEALIDLIDACAETRHRCGRIYNARTEAARKAVIEALSGVQALSAAPAGWKLVPVNPTPEMWKAAKSVPDPNPPYPPHYGLVWDAMLAASPTPTAEQQAQSCAVYAGLPDSVAWLAEYGGDVFTATQLLNFADRTHALRMQAAPKAAPGGQNESAYQRGYMDGMAKGRREVEAAPQQEAQEPVAYVHVPHYTVEGKVRPVVSFEKYQQDYDDGIYSTRIPLYTAPQPAPHLPERDASLPAERQGLFRKFVVGRVDGSDKPGGKHCGCTYFVLDVDHDPCARPALAAYAAACEPTHPTLAADLRTKWGVVPAPQPAPAPLSDDVVQDAARYRFLAGHCRSTGEHWGGRWSIVVDGPAPKSHDSEDDFDAAVDAALAAQGGK